MQFKMPSLLCTGWPGCTVRINYTCLTWNAGFEVEYTMNTIIGASLSEPLLDELAGAFLWYIYIYI